MEGSRIKMGHGGVRPCKGREGKSGRCGGGGGGGRRGGGGGGGGGGEGGGGREKGRVDLQLRREKTCYEKGLYYITTTTTTPVTAAAVAVIPLTSCGTSRGTNKSS
uniref:Uncharacterized protein n=1 Tax=Vespula pensylvanica TaxID=30213 RepID=A0A834KZ98_VESPE|nr:hypothetical protein H0235_012742 [Vespula pensylvanica]